MISNVLCIVTELRILNIGYARGYILMVNWGRSNLLPVKGLYFLVAVRYPIVCA